MKNEANPSSLKLRRDRSVFVLRTTPRQVCQQHAGNTKHEILNPKQTWNVKTKPILKDWPQKAQEAH